MAQEEDQNIKITFDTNAKEAAKDTNALGKSIDKTEKATDGLSKSNKELSKSQKDNKKSSEDQKAGFEDLGGGVGGAISQVKAFGKQLLLLMANPIILFLSALVGILALVAKAFTNSFEGGEKVEQVMAGITATGQALLDNLEKIGVAIVKALTFDFAGAKKEMSEVVDSATNAYKTMAALTKEAQQLARDQADNDLDAIKRQATLADLKDKLLDDSVGFAEKKKIQAELLKASEANAKSDIDLARQIATNKIAALTLEKDGYKKNYVEIQKIKADQLRGEVQNSNELKQIRKQGAALDNEEKARIKQLIAERKEASKLRLAQLNEEKKARQALLDEEVNVERAMLRRIQDLNDKTDEEKLARQKERASEEIEALKKKGIDVTDILIYNEELYTTLEQELLQKRADEKAELEKTEAEKAEKARKEQAEKDLAEQKKIDDAKLAQEKAIQEGRMSLAESFVGFLKNIAGKNKTLQKAAILVESALGIGKSVIATNASNVAATAEGAALAIPTGGASVATAAGLVATNYVTLGLGIASNIAATTTALQALGGGGAPSAGNTRNGQSSTPSVAFNNTSENQIGQSVSSSQAEQPPLKVYVAESDISNAQDSVKVLVNKNTF